MNASHTVNIPRKFDLAKWIKIAAITIGVIALIVLFVKWSNQHDAQAEKAYTAYEACVKAQYGVTPTAYYQEHGTSATCN